MKRSTNLPPHLTLVAPEPVEPHVEEDAAAGAVPQLLTVDDVAEALGVSRWQIYRASAAGRIPSVRLGRSVRFELEAVIASLRRGPAPPPGASHPAPASAPLVRRRRRPRPPARTTSITTEPQPHLPSSADRLQAALAATSGLTR